MNYPVDRPDQKIKTAFALDNVGRVYGHIPTSMKDTGGTVELHPFVVLTGYDPKPVVLDFVQPRLAGRWVRGGCGKARRVSSTAGRARGQNDMAAAR